MQHKQSAQRAFLSEAMGALVQPTLVQTQASQLPCLSFPVYRNQLGLSAWRISRTTFIKFQKAGK
jgi:hypothetical protein